MRLDAQYSQSPAASQDASRAVKATAEISALLHALRSEAAHDSSTARAVSS
jgi:hypothetical protein